MKIYDSAKKLGREILFFGGLASMLISGFGCSTSIGAEDWSCKRTWQGAIIAEKGDKKTNLYEGKRLFREKYSGEFSRTNLSRYEALEAIDKCQKAFQDYDALQPKSNP